VSEIIQQAEGTLCHADELLTHIHEATLDNLDTISSYESALDTSDIQVDFVHPGLVWSKGLVFPVERVRLFPF